MREYEIKYCGGIGSQLGGVPMTVPLLVLVRRTREGRWLRGKMDYGCKPGELNSSNSGSTERKRKQDGEMVKGKKGRTGTGQRREKGIDTSRCVSPGPGVHGSPHI